jgi:hypothetical protein
VNLTVEEAAVWIRSELQQAGDAMDAGKLDAALDGYVRAMGLALQLGPAPVEEVLSAVLAVTRGQNTATLAALGPALVNLVEQVRRAGVLPGTAVMEAWAMFVGEVGALVGQAGVALSVPPGRRAAMVDSLRSRAAILDETTSGLFRLLMWLDEVIAVQ